MTDHEVKLKLSTKVLDLYTIVALAPVRVIEDRRLNDCVRPPRAATAGAVVPSAVSGAWRRFFFALVQYIVVSHCSRDYQSRRSEDPVTKQDRQRSSPLSFSGCRQGKI